MRAPFYTHHKRKVDLIIGDWLIYDERRSLARERIYLRKDKRL